MNGTLRTLLAAAESPDLLAEHDHETHVRFSRFCRRCVAELNLVQVGRERARRAALGLTEAEDRTAIQNGFRLWSDFAREWGDLANGPAPEPRS